VTLTADTAADVLAGLPPLEPVDVAAAPDDAAPRKSRSGTSGAERRRRAAAGSSSSTSSSSTPASDKRAPKSGTTSRPRVRPLAGRLTDSFTLIGIGVSAFHPADGAAVITGAPALADSLAKLADENPNMKRALEGAMQASAWGGVMVAAASIAIPIAANHGALPPQVGAMFGGVVEGAPVDPATSYTVPQQQGAPSL